MLPIYFNISWAIDWSWSFIFCYKKIISNRAQKFCLPLVSKNVKYQLWGLIASLGQIPIQTKYLQINNVYERVIKIQLLQPAEALLCILFNIHTPACLLLAKIKTSPEGFGVIFSVIFGMLKKERRRCPLFAQQSPVGECVTSWSTAG